MKNTITKASWEGKLKTIIGGFCWSQDGGNGGSSFEDVITHINTAIAQTRAEAIEKCIKIVEGLVHEEPFDDSVSFDGLISWRQKNHEVEAAIKAIKALNPEV
jgi:hypothetical protein